jgi:hypothetical protein
MAEEAAITFRYRMDDYAVVQLLTNVNVTVGEEVEISGVPGGFNDSGVIVTALPQYKFLGTDSDGVLMYDYEYPIPNQVLYQNPGADVEYGPCDPYGSLEYAYVCTWFSVTELTNYLGITVATTAETTFLTQCRNSANSFCFRRRREAGYSDQLAVVPDESVKLGAIMYGAALYRQRGSIDTFASFDQMSTAPVTGLSPMIKALLGIDRPQVA